MNTTKETKTTNTETTTRAVDAGSKTLTVVVQDDKSQPTEGANVSITPSDASGVTNDLGEFIFKLGTANKYDITASYGSSTVTVPYYVTKDGATRLVVNPVYVKSIEKNINPSVFTDMYSLKNIGIGVGVLILLVIIIRIFKKK